MAKQNTIEQQLLDMLATRNFNVEKLNATGDHAENADETKTITFDYVSSTGKNYGTMVIVLDVDNDMKIMYGDNLGRTMEGDDKSEFFEFLEHLGLIARRNHWTKTIQDISQLKHTMQGMAAIQEGLFEGYYGTRKISYAGQPTEARLQIIHSQPLGENDARHRYIDRIFIETVDGERFKLGFKSLSGAKAMLEHVRQGGKPYDIRGCHITETVNEISVLSRFNRASANRILEGTTQELVTEAQAYYQTLRENLKHMATSRGYAKYFESWHPATITEQEGVVDNIKTLFIEQSIDSRIEAALPLLARIQQRGHDMKEAEIFENWINNLSEGTWSLPETPEQLDKLKTLMTKELIVGPDAVNATEQLYDLVGDDVLFDRLSELAARDPRANAWNDTEVMNRLAELGIELPEPAAADVSAQPQPEQQPMAEDGGSGLDQLLAKFPKSVAAFKAGGDLDYDLESALWDYYFDRGDIKNYDADASEWIANQLADHLGMNEGNAFSKAVVDAKRDGIQPGEKISVGGKEYPVKEQGMAEGDNLATFEDINRMLNLAGVPIKEHRMLDESGETLDHILNRFKHEVKNFEADGELDNDLYDALFDYYSDSGEMPYGVAKARTGDPYNWIADQLGRHLNLGENLIAPVAMPVATEGSTCNMTAEGEYCPEHGLAECGVGMPAGIMGENVFDKPKHDDPINYNAAITGSYNESNELARIKSLALLK